MVFRTHFGESTIGNSMEKTCNSTQATARYASADLNTLRLLNSLIVLFKSKNIIYHFITPNVKYVRRQTKVY